MDEPNSQKSQSSFWGLVLFAAVAGLFEIYTPAGVTEGVIYVPLVLCSIWFSSRYISFAFAGIASLLSIAGYFLASNYGADDQLVLLNRTLGVMAVWITAGVVFLKKKTREALIVSEERLRLMLDNTPIGIALVDLGGKFLQVNSALCEILGYTTESLLKVGFHSITHPDDLGVGLELLKKLSVGEIEALEQEKRYIHKDGSIVWAVSTVAVVKSSTGKPQCFVAQILDISVRKAAEEKLRAVVDFQDLVLNTIPDLVLVKDDQLRIVQANEAFINAYPKEKKDKIIGYTTFEDYDRQERELFTANDRVALAEGYHETEERVQMPDGKQRTLFTKKVRFTGDGSTYILGVCRDITAIKETQDELEKANGELEMFSYIASHDLKAPLRAINNLSQWIFDDLQAVMSDDVKHRFELMQSRVKRLETMLKDILEYSRAGRITEEPIELSLNPLVESIFDDIGTGEKFTLNIPNKLPDVFSPLTPLEQIFGNLLNNAVKHHDCEEGSVTITWIEKSGYIEFSILDDGPGIPEAFHEKIFVMFQTLKPRDVTEGTGLGMSIIRKLTELQGGNIWVESIEGQRGTTFKFTWPKVYRRTEDAMI